MMTEYRLPPLGADGSFELWPRGIPTPDNVKSDQVPRLTPYPSGRLDPHGVVIVFPGGGYGGLADHEAEPIARWLNSAGFSAFVLRYRVAPHRYPAALMDAHRAIRFVRCYAREWNINPARVGILGFSAGGHLASTAGTRFDAGDQHATDPVERHGCRPDAMVLCYPVITFGHYRHDGSMVTLLGERSPDSLKRSLSSELQVNPRTPATFLWHTMSDEGVPVENSLLFAAALSRSKVAFELHVFPHGAHGMGLAKDDAVVSAWTSLCATWLQQQGF